MSGPGAKGRVLVVDDDEDVRTTFRTLLELASYEVVCARNGKEALDLLHGEPVRRPDVILLDLRMPVLDGWQFRLAQRRDPALAQIPVVAISADDSPQAEAIDADGFLHKPPTWEELVATVGRIALQVRTRRQQDERLVQTERLSNLGQVAAEVAHEINNSLAYLSANLRSVSRSLHDPGPLSQDQVEDNRAALDEALEGASRIEQIVSDIAVFSHDGDGRERVQDLRPILDSAIKVVQGRIQKRAQLVRDYQGEPCVRASPARLAQVFLNLMVNAVDAIAPGEPAVNRITVSTRVYGGFVHVDVADTGSGIGDEVLAHIFERFFTTKAVGAGTGLGLFVSQGLVRAMGGDLRVTTQVGKGSTFRVSLPLAAPDLDHAGPPRAPAAPPSARVLVVDDEPHVLRAFQRLLAPAYDATVAASAQEALQRLAADPEFDLILCDLHMPGMSGPELWEALRQVQPVLGGRVVFMTAGILDSRTLAFAQSLPAPVLGKPIELAHVAEQLARLRGRRTTVG